MKWIAYAKESFNGYSHRHEYGSTETDVSDWIDDEWEADIVCITANFEGLECIIYATDYNIGGIETGQSQEKLMEAVPQFWF